MRRSHHVTVAALAAFSTILFPGEESAAGQLTYITTPLADASCVFLYSSPTNQANSMGIETFEFAMPVTDNVRCCISFNNTGQSLYINVLALYGTDVSNYQTSINGTGCTPYVSLAGGPTFQCNVAAGINFPVTAGSTYRIAICRQ
jgi:hypothetical protein